MQDNVAEHPGLRSSRIWIGLVIGLIIGAGIAVAAAAPHLWQPLLRGSAPEPMVLPESIGIGSYPAEIPPVQSLLFLDMTAPYRALAEASYADVWETTYLWRPDRPLHARETRQMVDGPATLIEMLDQNALDSGWTRDDRFRHEGWAITSAGYQRDGYVFAIAILGRRAAHAQEGQIVIGPDADAATGTDTVLPVAIFTNLPRPQNPTVEAPWIAPDAWRTQ